MTEPKANIWLHALLAALRIVLQTSGDLSARSLQALQERLIILTASVVVRYILH
jgi:hypothetical protein